MTENEPCYGLTPKGERLLRMEEKLREMILEQRKEACDLLSCVQFYIGHNQPFEAATSLVSALDLIEGKGADGLDGDGG